MLQYRRQIAMVFQENLLFRTSVWNNIATGLRFRKIPEQEVARRIQAWARQFCIEHLLDRPAWRLSGGEAKKVCLARALVLAPSLLLLDEPFNDLDPASRINLRIELHQLLHTQRISAVWITHDHSEARHLADRLVVMGEGRILQCGPPEVIHQCPVNSQVAQFIGVHALLDEAVLPPVNGRAGFFVERRE
jgi:tungstate transport system ATP-binding protein